MNSLKKLLDFLNQLDEHGLGYSMEHNREDTITVLIAVPGERWEVEFHPDGEVEVEVFYSAADEEDLEGEEALERLFALDDDDYDDEDVDEEDDDDEDYDLEEYELEEDDEEDLDDKR
ncbi:hypothetical protein ACXYTJ_02975 [Gilvimarinus sp. F26214L]|uniref:hypothetical protein n=1 Tax=Gilvimarinus sp. DZF01 TaxID=3461371 RepID=UPI00404659F6